MWAVLAPDGAPVFWNPSWDVVVTWAMKQGGDLDILFREFAPDLVLVQGDIDIHGDTT